MDIEEIILGMADLVMENRALRELIKDLQLENKKNEAYANHRYEEGHKLSEMICHNASVRMTQSAGWIRSDDQLTY